MTRVFDRPNDGDSPSRTILVVDDEEVVRMLVSRALIEAGHAVVEASHAAAALALLRVRAPDLDLVVCDLVMPGPNRQGIARWLATHRPALPILLISGYPLRPTISTTPACPFCGSPSCRRSCSKRSKRRWRRRSPSSTGTGARLAAKLAQDMEECTVRRRTGPGGELYLAGDLRTLGPVALA